MLSEKVALWGGPHDGLEVTVHTGQTLVYMHQGLMSATWSSSGGPGDGLYEWDGARKRFEWKGVIA